MKKQWVTSLPLYFLAHVWIPEAQQCNCKVDDLHTITVVDLNIPNAKSSESVNDLCTCIQFANDLAPGKTVALLEFPDMPKKTSKRGLFDEEEEVQTCLWSLRQTCDSRWICPFTVHPSAELQTNRRSEVFL